ncbi:hypothetical protein HPB47_003830, partial [Ixodes persulcatus]
MINTLPTRTEQVSGMPRRIQNKRQRLEEMDALHPGQAFSISTSPSVKVVDAQGMVVPVNTKGELCTRGPHVFKGYLNDDAMTKEAIRDNWYHTGDEGTINEEGRITFLGRIKEVIFHIGVNVSPLEIENLLNTHPDVEEAQ